MKSLYSDVAAEALRAFHDRAIAQDDAAGTALPDGVDEAWRWIAANHRCNRLLWVEEDLARRTDVPDAEIARNKRAIDLFNQQRNDAVEHIDEALLARSAAVPLQKGAWHNSETAGAMIDRLSILALKIHAMGNEARRADATDAHRAACAEKLGRLTQQRDDLARCLDTLFARAAVGWAFWRVYRQFKMYNDPDLNPQLYGRRQ
jgi:hypothetical protein